MWYLWSGAKIKQETHVHFTQASCTYLPCNFIQYVFRVPVFWLWPIMCHHVWNFPLVASCWGLKIFFKLEHFNFQIGDAQSALEQTAWFLNGHYVIHMYLCNSHHIKILEHFLHTESSEIIFKIQISGNFDAIGNDGHRRRLNQLNTLNIYSPLSYSEL
jgi:hypothetical protein